MLSKIKFFLILGVIVLGIASIGYFKAIPGVQNQESLPKIEITPKTFDFGEINFGDVVNYSFQVKNLGKEILEIKRLATSCPCATAKIAKEKIEPGEEVELLVSYDSEMMGPAHGKGRQERIIYVKSNDPVNPQVEVMIYATIK
jgi:hypothetical protein